MAAMAFTRLKHACILKCEARLVGDVAWVTKLAFSNAGPTNCRQDEIGVVITYGLSMVYLWIMVLI